MKISLPYRSGLFLLWLLFKRDLRLRYAGAGLGTFWNFFHPILLFGVYALVFGYFLKFRARLLGREVDFLPYLFTGFWPWIAFNEGLLRCAYILFEYANIIKRIRFPVAILIPLGILGGLIPLIVGFSLLTLFLFLKGGLYFTPFKLFLFVIPLGLQLLWSFGLGFLVAAFTAYVRDLQQLLPSLLNLWFFLTPVIYSLELVPPWLRDFLEANPWNVILAWYRQLFLSSQINWGLGEGWVLMAGIVIFYFGFWCFRRCSRHFADIL